MVTVRGKNSSFVKTFFYNAKHHISERFRKKKHGDVLIHLREVDELRWLPTEYDVYRWVSTLDGTYRFTYISYHGSRILSIWGIIRFLNFVYYKNYDHDVPVQYKLLKNVVIVHEVYLNHVYGDYGNDIIDEEIYALNRVCGLSRIC